MLLSLRNVSKTYATPEGKIEVLKGIDFDLPAAQSVALTGESGSGKSTLLHLVAGLDQPDSGQILVAGRDIAGLGDRGRAAYRRSDVGLIFQQFNLIPSLDVAANISFHARLAGRQDTTWETQLIETLGLTSLMRRYPEQLSGGQQQRVAIARTLAARPALVLADEPTGNLDETTGDTVLGLMLSLTKSSGAALLMVTHSPRLALMLDGSVLLRSGRIA
ncbi:ABC transporter ATP-binding protein [Rhizobium deserti]|uniref:ABC transporter ATP-binding protein n=1 Tax=Rhizobium deserti TaxID=2547961 RepID=A0A4R5U9T3_9HYPH|nr:ABC transporter ATP-binding protein [Rhizobium deserti]TDK31361.1 ABC transporter ATP-binding protein [Rhizobium deserti]